MNFINISDAKPERITLTKGLGIFKESLSNQAYKQLRDYLYGNDKLLAELDDLYLSKHKNLTNEVVNLINKYNVWVLSTK